MGSAFLSDYVGACFRELCEQIGEYRMNYFVATTGNDAIVADLDAATALIANAQAKLALLE